jgi:hypothetical protein
VAVISNEHHHGRRRLVSNNSIAVIGGAAKRENNLLEILIKNINYPRGQLVSIISFRDHCESGMIEYQTRRNYSKRNDAPRGSL